MLKKEELYMKIKIKSIIKIKIHLVTVKIYINIKFK